MDVNVLVAELRETSTVEWMKTRREIETAIGGPIAHAQIAQLEAMFHRGFVCGADWSINQARQIAERHLS